MEDKWENGELYESYVGRWSRPVAAAFLEWLDLPEGARWLDVGCGTGALTQTILDRCRPAATISVDPSEGFLGVARRAIDDPRARFEIGEAASLPVGDGEVDAVVSGLVLNFVPDKPAALTDMARAAGPGGTVAAYVWDYAGRMELMRRFWDAAAALDPAAAELDEGVRFPETSAEGLLEMFENAGFEEVETRAIDVPTKFVDFDDHWTPFFSGVGPAPGYCVSLNEPSRVALREHLRETLPTADDGSISLVARAWAVRGRTASAG
jgi:ubiquinone/menaquinone biosynthesis C-methylase UbiE